MTLGEMQATLSLFARHYAGRGMKGGELPDPERALAQPDGLAGVCTDLSLPSLMRAYGRGLYPCSGFGPQKWWAPRQRMVLFIENFRLGSRLAESVAARRYKVTFDTAFAEVVAACSRPRPRQGERRWIRRDIARAFTAAFEAGVAHSVEVWDEEGVLIGGAYGLALGKVFFTEAQFSEKPDAGKIGFATLNCHLQRWGFLLNDAKRPTGALCQQGFTPVTRRSLNRFLEKACAVPSPMGRWCVDERLRIAGWEPRAHWLAGAA